MHPTSPERTRSFCHSLHGGCPEMNGGNLKQMQCNMRNYSYQRVFSFGLLNRSCLPSGSELRVCMIPHCPSDLSIARLVEFRKPAKCRSFQFVGHLLALEALSPSLRQPTTQEASAGWRSQNRFLAGVSNTGIRIYIGRRSCDQNDRRGGLCLITAILSASM